jgi:hypothetical protein
MNVTRCEFDAYSEPDSAEISEIGPSWLDFSVEKGDTSYICPPLDTPQGLRRGSVFLGACGHGNLRPYKLAATASAKGARR